MSKLERDLSQGSVTKQLLAFAVPFIISNLIQALYNVADMVIVGQFSGTVSMSGVNIGGQVTLIMTNLVVGLCSGGTVLIGQYKGYGAKKELKETIGTLLSTLIILAMIFTVIMEVARVPILRLINTPQESFAEAQNYLFITMLGLIFIFGYNALSAIMRGMGDSKRPLIFVSIACVTNIILDVILVAGFKMGASGAAIATVFSQALSMVLCIIFLRKNDFVFDFNKESFKIHKDRLRLLLKIGIPTSVQNVVTSVSFMILTAMVNTFGVTASAALGAVGKYNSFAILPTIAISSSVAAMSAQNIGAGREDRAIKTLKTGILMAFAMSLVGFSLAALLPEKVLRIFADDGAMIAEGVKYLRYFKYDYILVPFQFGLTGLFIGAGHSKFSLINGVLASIIIRAPAAYFFGMMLDMGLVGMGIAAPLATAVAITIGIWFFFSGKWKKATILADHELEKLSV